jgi:hypothetical protein
MLLPVLPAQAQVADPGAVADALRIDEVMGVMQAEGLDYGAQLEAELFPGGGGARWQAAVARIYDAAAMERRFSQVFGAEIGDEPEAMAAIVDFFGDARGQRIVTLEIEARRALLDEAVEDAAKVAFQDMEAERDPRIGLLQRFAEANDLIEQNVAGALNSNLAFYRGLSEGGAFGEAMAEPDILADVWSQEADIRAETEDWLFPYLALAYQPLPDEDVEAYIAFSETGAGEALNAALFAAFDAIFTDISEELGRSAAQLLSGQDI